MKSYTYVFHNYSVIITSEWIYNKENNNMFEKNKMLAQGNQNVRRNIYSYYLLAPATQFLRCAHFIAPRLYNIPRTWRIKSNTSKFNAVAWRAMFLPKKKNLISILGEREREKNILKTFFANYPFFYVFCWLNK